MAEIETEVLEDTKKEPVKVASMGKVQRVSQAVQPKTETEKEAPKEEAKEDKETTADTTQVQTAEPIQQTSLSEEQRKSFLKELFGDENVDVEAIKEKLKPTPPEPSEEEKKKAKSEKEIRALKLFVEQGGTPEQFNELKNIATGDKIELSKKKALTEFISAGFTEKEANDMLKNQFYQIELDNIEQDLGLFILKV